MRLRRHYALSSVSTDKPTIHVVPLSGATSNQFDAAAAPFSEVLEILEEWNSYLEQNAPSFRNDPEPSP
jgi:hypothetical protein